MCRFFCSHLSLLCFPIWILLEPSELPPFFSLPTEQYIWRKAAVIIYASHSVGQDLSHYLGEVWDESTWDFFPCLIDGQNLFLFHICVFHESVFLCWEFQLRLSALHFPVPCPLLVGPADAFITICSAADDRYWC